MTTPLTTELGVSIFIWRVHAHTNTHTHTQTHTHTHTHPHTHTHTQTINTILHTSTNTFNSTQELTDGTHTNTEQERNSSTSPRDGEQRESVMMHHFLKHLHPSFFPLSAFHTPPLREDAANSTQLYCFPVDIQQLTTYAYTLYMSCATNTEHPICLFSIHACWWDWHFKILYSKQHVMISGPCSNMWTRIFQKPGAMHRCCWGTTY